MLNFEQTDNAMEILDCLLEAKGRRLTQSQRDVVREQISIEPTALYVRITSDIVVNWRSTMQVTASDLPGGISGILKFLFAKVSSDFGKSLTKFAFGFLTYSLEGVSDSEMCDLLSLSEEVMKEVNQYNSAHRLPNHVWLRLRSSIENVIAEQNGGCIKWYHRQLKEFAETWASDREFVCHDIMGRYFGNIVPRSILVEKNISPQALVLSDATSDPSSVVFCDVSVLNSRRFQEAAHHLLSAKLVKEAQAELCSISAVAARGRIGVIFQYLDELGRLQNLSSADPLVNHYFRWMLRDDAHYLSRHPTQLGCCTTQPMVSLARKDFDSFRRNLKDCPFGTIESVSFGRMLGGFQEFAADLNILSGHESEVISVCFSPDKTKIASASNDKTIRIWDSFSGKS